MKEIERTETTKRERPNERGKKRKQWSMRHGGELGRRRRKPKATGAALTEAGGRQAASQAEYCRPMDGPMAMLQLCMGIA